MDRDIDDLKREEKKHVAECKKLASRDKKAIMFWATEIGWGSGNRILANKSSGTC